MSDTAPLTEEQAMLADLQRVQTEYDEAVGDLLAQKRNGVVSASVKMRSDRAQVALHEVRDLWRSIGEAVGNRGEWVAVEHNTTEAPSLIEGA